MTIEQAAKSALDVQDACNLSGVVFSFAEAMRAVCTEAERRGEGTDWKNHHPVSVLYASKIVSLTDGTLSNVRAFGQALDACEKITEGDGDGAR